MSGIRDSNNNYYDILEVANDAPQNEVHKAYQRAKVTYSQDNPALYSMFTKDEAKELTHMIEEAYAILGNQSLRKKYDEVLRNGLSTQSFIHSVSNKPQTTDGRNQSMTAADKAHAALPDFAIPEADQVAYEKSEPIRRSQPVKTQHPVQQSVPDGHGRTALSTFKIDPTIESEIAAAKNFDGAFLKKIRLYKNVELDKLSEHTRVSRTYLTAVENNNFKALPAPVFVRGFVVQVARLLGLNDSQVANSYMTNLKATVGKE